MQKLLNDKELARVLGCSPITIRNNRHWAPDRLPPAVRIGRSVRWREETIMRWLEELEEGAGGLEVGETETPGIKPEVRRRGRPTKVEQAARRAGRGR